MPVAVFAERTVWPAWAPREELPLIRAMALYPSHNRPWLSEGAHALMPGLRAPFGLRFKNLCNECTDDLLELHRSAAVVSPLRSAGRQFAA
jgi:hypothetical protein